MSPPATPSAIGRFQPAGHDHQQCMDTALEQASLLCREQGLRLTPIRKRVLELVWSNHKPVGAYAILEQLTADGHKAMPPTVYRALDFLRSAALVHKLDSLNAYIGCGNPGVAHNEQFFICTNCGTVAELADPKTLHMIEQQADAVGFQVQSSYIEVSGICNRCVAETADEAESTTPKFIGSGQ
jgi:Fur family zinc uptake transcriptional regulator